MKPLSVWVGMVGKQPLLFSATKPNLGSIVPKELKWVEFREVKKKGGKR